MAKLPRLVEEVSCQNVTAAHPRGTGMSIMIPADPDRWARLLIVDARPWRAPLRASHSCAADAVHCLDRGTASTANSNVTGLVWLLWLEGR